MLTFYFTWDMYFIMQRLSTCMAILKWLDQQSASQSHQCYPKNNNSIRSISFTATIVREHERYLVGWHCFVHEFNLGNSWDVNWNIRQKISRGKMWVL